MIQRVVLGDNLEALDRYNENEVSISVMREGGSTFAAALAQADNVEDRWWVSRVIVRSREARGQGLGSIALQRLLAVIARISKLPVYVAPGGYESDPSDPEKQFRFYLKNGFQRIAGDSETLIWTAEACEKAIADS